MIRLRQKTPTPCIVLNDVQTMFTLKKEAKRQNLKEKTRLIVLFV
jgi:hypothetical protein